jgi:nucleotide-binding universal stress UspA family protein
MYKKILVPVDGSATSLRGLDEAIGLAKTCGAMLDIVHVVNEQVFDTGYMPAPFYEQLFESQREGGRKVLAAAEDVARRHEVDFRSDLLEVVGGGAADRIVSHAKERAADVIVMGTHGRRGLRRLAMGSDAEMVVRSSPVPVLLVRDQPEVP